MNEPNLPQTIHDVLSQNRTGTLATFGSKHPEFPFASVTTYSVAQNGEPIFFFSSMARHSKNIARNPNASLLVVADGKPDQSGGVLASGRVTIIGKIVPIDEHELEEVRSDYLTTNPEANQWASFGDFQFYRMKVVDTYVVAGFGAMGWVKPD